MARAYVDVKLGEVQISKIDVAMANLGWGVVDWGGGAVRDCVPESETRTTSTQRSSPTAPCGTSNPARPRASAHPRLLP